MPYHYTTDVVYIYLIINLNEKTIFFYTGPGVEVHELWHKSILPMFLYIKPPLVQYQSE